MKEMLELCTWILPLNLLSLWEPSYRWHLAQMKESISIMDNHQLFRLLLSKLQKSPSLKSISKSNLRTLIERSNHPSLRLILALSNLKWMKWLELESLVFLKLLYPELRELQQCIQKSSLSLKTFLLEKVRESDMPL